MARLSDSVHPTRPVWMVVEIEEEPEKGILYRLGHYQFGLGKEVNPDCDPRGPVVGSLLINLTGSQATRRLQWAFPGDDLGTHLAPLIVDVAQQEAAETVDRIEAGILGLMILPYVALMAGGEGPALVPVGGRLPNASRRRVGGCSIAMRCSFLRN